MNSQLRFIAFVLLALFGLGRLGAASAPAQATVVSIKGTDATVKLPDGSSRALKAGDSLPQGAVITTGAKTVVMVKAMTGAASAIQADSRVALEEMSVTTENGSVTKNKAVLDLQVGDIVSAIDPANKAVSDYSVRTPKGVFKAVGTVFTIKVPSLGGAQIEVKVVAGQVTASLPQFGGATITFTKTGVTGVANLGGAAQTQLDAILKEGSLTATLAGAIAATVGEVAGNPGSFGTTQASAVAEMKDAVQTLAQAAPAATATIVSSAAAGIKGGVDDAVRAAGVGSSASTILGAETLGGAVILGRLLGEMTTVALQGAVAGGASATNAIQMASSGLQGAGVGINSAAATTILQQVAQNIGGTLAEAVPAVVSAPPTTTPPISVDIVTVSPSS